MSSNLSGTENKNMDYLLAGVPPQATNRFLYLRRKIENTAHELVELRTKLTQMEMDFEGMKRESGNLTIWIVDRLLQAEDHDPENGTPPPFDPAL